MGQLRDQHATKSIARTSGVHSLNDKASLVMQLAALARHRAARAQSDHYSRAGQGSHSLQNAALVLTDSAQLAFVDDEQVHERE